MDYICIYESLINKARDEFRVKSKDVLYEKHHIIPKSIGGNNSKENLVL